jgi:cytoplasmic FMR1 interacting protein
MASLQDALTNVRCLQDFSLPDEQPTIEPEPTSIVYEVSFDTNFADRTAFITGSGRYNEEATICSGLNVILEEGERYAGMLYTWRCLSRAVPAIKNNEQANRMEIYEKTIEVLGPEVEKAKEFLRFMQKAANSFTEEVKTLSHPERRKDFISEYYLLTLARLINMFSTLDALKNMKACINNDLACYRRAESILRRGAMDAFAIEESQNLSLFFATNNSITNMIKKNLEEVPGFEEVLVETINLCCTHYEAQMYIVPEEKYQLLKAMGYGMVLLDGNVVNINKLKKLNVSRIDRIFKAMPVAPLYGDVQIKLPLLVKGLPHHDPGRWSCTSESLDDKLSITITDKIDQIRQEHVQIMSRLARYNNEIITSSQFALSDKSSKEMYDMALKAVQLLTSWTTSVVEMYSWKLLHPTNHYDNKDCPPEAEDYEKASRYNYNSEEKYALVEVIAMIKGLALLMQRMEKHFSQAIRRHIYVRMQEFVQIGIRESIRHTSKKKKHKPKTILVGLRDVCVDWLNGEPRDDPAIKGDKDPKGGFKVDVPRKAVRPSSTQLYMMRTMLESLISDKTGAEKRPLKFDLKDSNIPEFEAFHRASFYYAKMLDLSSTLHECSSLPQLWFREFFLELTMGERIQFPIEMSLLWILTDHILENKEAHMMEYILYPLDLYSDSAHYALHHFKKQFLYDEVEAEVNLCFDQMVYKLSEQIFSHFKQMAANMYLDKRFRSETTAKLPYPSPNRYETILKQRHVQLLGRSIDLNRLLAQRLGASMLKAIDTVIHKFESSDITRVVELEALMEINRLTHTLLMEHVTLDPFPVMLNEANQAINSPHGRITLHVFWELHYDFLPNFCYNSTTDRFVRSKLPHDVQEREHHPKGPGTTTMLYGSKPLREAYQSALSTYENFVGPEHFAAMSHLLGYQGTSMVIQQLLNIMNSSVSGSQHTRCWQVSTSLFSANPVAVHLSCSV